MVFGRTIIANQFLEEGVWQWSNGDPWSYENWHAGEPNNVDNEVGIKKNRKVRSKQEMFFFPQLGSLSSEKKTINSDCFSMI